jgi:hypothetical protein
MAKVERSELVREVAKQTGLSIPAAALKVTDVVAELELEETTEFSEKVAGEIEWIIGRDVREQRPPQQFK